MIKVYVLWFIIEWLFLLNFVVKCVFVIVILIVLVIFCFNGFVIVLILGVWLNLGCFGVLLFNFLKFFKLLIEMLYLVKWSKLYSRFDLCFVDKMNWLWLNYFGWLGLWFKWFVYNV